MPEYSRVVARKRPRSLPDMARRALSTCSVGNAFPIAPNFEISSLNEPKCEQSQVNFNQVGQARTQRVSRVCIGRGERLFGCRLQ
jgi:hypothetical protein